MKKLSIAVCLFFLSTAQIFAATYFVNGGAAPYVGTQGTYAVGEDGAGIAGTLAAPWATLNYAESQTSDADTIYVAADIYIEDDATRHNWKATKALTWIADGTVIVQAVTTTIGVLECVGTKTQSFTGFTFDMETDNAYGVYNRGGTRTFTNCTWVNPKSTGFIFYAYEAITAWNIVNPTVSGACVSVFNTGIAPVTVTGGTFNNSGQFFLMDHADNTAAITFNGSSITWNVTTGARTFYIVGSPALSITNCTNIALSGTNVILVEASTAAKTGAITISGNTVTSAAQHANLCLINNGAHAISIANNNVTSSHAASTTALVRIVNQAAPSITGNTFNTIANTGANVTHISLTSTGTDSSSPVITGNTFRSRSLGGYVILIGTETSGAGDAQIDGANISNNFFYGPLYYDNTITNATIHNVIIGHNKNATIRKNYINGMGYAFVLKGSPIAWTAGDVSGNIIVNCLRTGTAGIRIKGAQAVPVYNNTIIVDDTITGVSAPCISISENAAGQEGSGAIVKNNIMRAYAAPMVYLDADALTDFVCETNAYYRSAGEAVAFSVDGGSSTINWAAWNALGYDTPGGLNADTRLTSAYVPKGSGKTGATPIWTYAQWVAMGGDYFGKYPTGGTLSMGAAQFQKRLEDDLTGDLILMRSKSTAAGSFAP